MVKMQKTRLLLVIGLLLISLLLTGCGDTGSAFYIPPEYVDYNSWDSGPKPTYNPPTYNSPTYNPHSSYGEPKAEAYDEDASGGYKYYRDAPPISEIPDGPRGSVSL